MTGTFSPNKVRAWICNLLTLKTRSLLWKNCSSRRVLVWDSMHSERRRVCFCGNDLVRMDSVLPLSSQLLLFSRFHVTYGSRWWCGSRFRLIFDLSDDAACQESMHTSGSEMAQRFLCNKRRDFSFLCVFLQCLALYMTLLLCPVSRLWE